MREGARETILCTVEDLVSNFLYYDRKEDDDLRRGEIEEAIAEGVISADEIVAKFRQHLVEGIE